MPKQVIKLLPNDTKISRHFSLFFFYLPKTQNKIFIRLFKGFLYFLTNIFVGIALFVTIVNNKYSNWILFLIFLLTIEIQTLKVIKFILIRFKATKLTFS